MRALMLFALALLRLSAAETGTPAAAPAEAAKPAGYHFSAGTLARLYFYECTQDVVQETAGETVRSRTWLRWTFALTSVPAAEHEAKLQILIIRIEATHRGPEGEHAVDSRVLSDNDVPRGADDKMLGNLLALRGVTLTLTMDPTTGVVSAVDGGEAIVDAIAKRAPAVGTDERSPLEASARALYSSASLARFWTEALLPPGTGTEKLPPAPPLDLALERHWKADHYDLALPAGGAGDPVTLMKDPTPVTAQVTRLDGSGHSSIDDGYPGEAGGEVTLGLTFSALTQPVAQTTHLVWRRGRVEK